MSVERLLIMPTVLSSHEDGKIQGCLFSTPGLRVGQPCQDWSSLGRCVGALTGNFRATAAKSLWTLSTTTSNTDPGLKDHNFQFTGKIPLKSFSVQL